MNFVFGVPALAVIAANLYPLVMTALGYWDATQVLVLYWTETVVVCFYNVLAILFASAPPPAKMYKGNVTLRALNSADSAQMLPRLLEDLGLLGRLVWAIASLFPFAMFMLISGLMIYALFFSMNSDLEGMLLSIKWGTLALFISHGVVFVKEYIGKGIFRATRPEELFDKPFPQLTVLLAAVVAGGGVTKWLHLSYMMIVFVIAKVVMELRPKGGYFSAGAVKKGT
jgi:hypothetical protein